MKILALESSCDDTACAIVDNGRNVLASTISAQTDTHRAFGGVVPEVASREHLLNVNEVVSQTLKAAGLSLDQVDAFAATLGPGLVGSLLIGANTAKTLSLLAGKPFLGVNHLQAHVASNYLESELKPPFLCLLISGGHTQLIHVKDYNAMAIVGETLDDAVGEAYDKVARLMGLPYPGGPEIDKLAISLASVITPEQIKGLPRLPKAITQNPFDFSFSGLKTATLRLFEKESQSVLNSDQQQKLVQKIAFVFQTRVIDTLYEKTLACAQHFGLGTIAIAGGVSANRGLRQRFESQKPDHLTVYFPQFKYCTDNAAMVASCAFFNPMTTELGQEVFSRSSV